MIFELQGTEKIISNSVGFPQGGVASAKLWILAFDGAIEIINSGGVYGIGFADDCCAVVGGNNLGFMVHKLQKCVNKLTECIWSEWRLTVIAATVRIALMDILDLSEVDIPAGGFLYPAVGWG